MTSVYAKARQTTGILRIMFQGRLIPSSEEYGRQGLLTTARDLFL